MMTHLTCDALRKVLTTLNAGLEKLKSTPPDTVDYDLYRNAAVKSFELSIEMSGKLLRKALRAYDLAPRVVDSLVFNDVLRTAGKHGLLEVNELERWFEYRRHRNAAAHDYGEKLADSVLELLTQYERDCRTLATRLDKVFAADA